ncbi:hypothetical protein C9374_005566 [Naegleria lovaniensis]|uniref:Uncharacterized protein n=1 Tax=Naegleria lovaniensis TaxID=51637 RepID=A0AA88GJZ0_NAELO|nr:uncharacterized protein C9374_005566 [Naegleria lovaniensis]KAG2382364.1 hypothetical protein C9374_005566 [Naegleria lovaniensis]
MTRLVLTIFILTVVVAIFTPTTTVTADERVVVQQNQNLGPSQYLYSSLPCSYGLYNITVNGYSYSSPYTYLYLYRTTSYSGDPRSSGTRITYFTEDEITDTSNNYYYALYNAGSTSITINSFTVTQTLKTRTTMTYESGTIPVGQVKLFQCTNCLYSSDYYVKMQIRKQLSSNSNFYVDVAFSTKYPSNPSSLYSYDFQSQNLYVTSSTTYTSTPERYVGSSTSSSRPLYVYVKCRDLNTQPCSFELSESSSYSSSSNNNSSSSSGSLTWIIGPIVGGVVFIVIFAITIPLSLLARRRRLYMLRMRGGTAATVVAMAAMEERNSTTYVPPPSSTMPPSVTTTYVSPQPSMTTYVQQPPMQQPMIQPGVVVPSGTASSSYYPPQQPGMYYQPPPPLPPTTSMVQPNPMVQPPLPSGVYYQPPPSYGNADVQYTSNGGGIYIPPPSQPQYEPMPAFNPNADKV